VVPNVVGATPIAASTSISNVGLVVGKVTTQASSTIAKDTVISQSPAAGASVAPNSVVSLVVSSGPTPILVPNVVGTAQTAASASISGMGLVVGTVTIQASSTVQKDTVISQSPAAGASVASGSAVNLVVSSGPVLVLVPNVVGATQTVASTSISAVGLGVGTVTTQASSTVPKDTVISQNPAAGTSVAPISLVNLVVSSGTLPVLVPNVVGETQTVATTSLTSVGLVLGTVTAQASSTVAKDIIISQSPAAGTSVTSGSAVNLIISSGSAIVLVPNVVGETQVVATSSLTGVGLELGTVTTQASSTIAKDTIISQNPAAGASVAPSTAVNVVVSSGPVTVLVPNVVGDTQAVATTSLTGVGLVLGTVSTETSTTVAKDTIISQDPAAGTSVALASTVNLVISSGSVISMIPPVANAGQDQTLECAGSYGTNVMLDGSGSSSSDGSPLTFAWSGSFGTATGPTPKVNLPMGINLITLMVTDKVGGIATASVVEKVVDTTPPIIKTITPSINSLWPPNHKMVPVTIDISASDICSATTTCKVVSIRSNEPVNGKGDGDMAPDWEINRNLSVNLRAERAGPRNKRDYTVTVQCTDDSGNSATKTVVISVPHNKKEERYLDMH